MVYSCYYVSCSVILHWHKYNWLWPGCCSIEIHFVTLSSPCIFLLVGAEISIYMGLFLLYVKNCRIWPWTVMFITMCFGVFPYRITVRAWRTTTPCFSEGPGIWFLPEVCQTPVSSPVSHPTPSQTSDLHCRAGIWQKYLVTASQVVCLQTCLLDVPWTSFIPSPFLGLSMDAVTITWCGKLLAMPFWDPTGGWLLLGEGTACAAVTLGSWFIPLSWGSPAFVSTWPLPWMQLCGR